MAVKKNEKKITVKSYVILSLIFIGAIVLTLYFCKCYEVYDAHQKEIPVLRDTLNEITDIELEHYILENPTTIIYMCEASNMICRDYEKDFKKLIEQNTLQDDIVYLNLNDLDQEKFLKDFNKSYPYKIKLTKYYPAIVMFEDGKIKHILQGHQEEKLTITKTKQFIELNKIGE